MRLKLYKNEHDRNLLRTVCVEKPFVEGQLVAHQLRGALLVGTVSGKNPIGLASNQMGLNSRVFIALIDGNWHSFINPSIEKHSDELVSFKEGCLSLKKEFKTKRYKWIKISYLDKKGKRVTEKYDGMNAIIIQHELDHLNGKLCKDGGINE